MIIIVILLLLILLCLLLRFKTNWFFLLSNFQKQNCIVFGRKGTGKDLLFSEIVRKRKAKHYSNIIYDNNTELISLKDVSAGNNTFQTLIAGDYKPFVSKFGEKKDIYISDAGIYLPSHMDTYLSKLYPSFPVAYALSRHLWNNNIHCNVQALNRVWIKIREQADFYVKVHRTYTFLKFFGFLIVKITTYDRYDTALRELQPMKTRYSREQRAVADIETTQRGDIRTMFLPIKIKKIKYNTRYFKDLLIDSPQKPTQA